MMVYGDANGNADFNQEIQINLKKLAFALFCIPIFG